MPALDANDGGSVSTPSLLPGGTTYRSYATVNVANAVAAIEGYIAINYLFVHHDWQYIDTSHTGTITAQEIQTFVDNANAEGLPEAGAMAALLGGTATYSAVEPGLNNEVFNENPGRPGRGTAPVQLLQLRRRRRAHRLDDHEPAQDALARAAPLARRLHHHRPPASHAPTAGCSIRPHSAISSSCSAHCPNSSGYPSRKSRNTETSRRNGSASTRTSRLARPSHSTPCSRRQTSRRASPPRKPWSLPPRA